MFPFHNMNPLCAVYVSGSWPINLLSRSTFCLSAWGSAAGVNRARMAPRKPWSIFTAISWTRAMKYLMYRHSKITARTHCELLNTNNMIVLILIYPPPHAEQVVTHLNCMTLLCWLNLVMMDTSMNGFGSAGTELRVKDTQLIRLNQIRNVSWNTSLLNTFCV